MFLITGSLGLALAVAPWIFNYSSDSTAMWTSVIVGGLVLLASVVKGVLVNTEDENANWEYWVAGLAGAVAIVAPFVLGFTALTAALWTSIIIGALVVIVSGYEVVVTQPRAS
jgi:hypothetical protein